MIGFALANGFLSTSRTKKVEKSGKVPGIRSITNCNFIDAKHARLISLQVSCYQLDYIFIVLFDDDTMANVHQLPKKNMKQVGLMRCDASVRASSSSASLTFMSLSFRMNYFGIHSRITLCGKSVAIHPQNHSEMMTTTDVQSVCLAMLKGTFTLLENITSQQSMSTCSLLYGKTNLHIFHDYKHTILFFQLSTKQVVVKGYYFPYNSSNYKLLCRFQYSCITLFVSACVVFLRRRKSRH